MAKQAARQALQATKKAKLEAKRAAKQANRAIPKPGKPVKARKPKVVVDIEGGP